MDYPTPPRVDFDTLEWFKSRASSENGACVEIAWAPEGRVALRDSKNPGQTPNLFTREEWTAFLDGAKNGEFDIPS